MIKGKHQLLLFMVLALFLSHPALARPLKPMRIGDKFIMTDTVWEGTVIINGLVKVASEVTLKIRPGSRILFSRTDSTNQAGTNALYVQGRLLAEGTREKPIVFTSNETSPRREDWMGINLIASDQRLNRLRFCEISFAKVGIHSHFSLLSVSDCTFTDNDRGVYFQDMKAEIENSHFTGNYSGLRGRGVQVSLVSCRFTGNYWGMDLNASQADLKGNRFTGNLMYGARLRNCQADLSDNLFQKNRIGLRSLNTTLRITGDRFLDNQDIGGMFLESHSSLEKTVFSGNAGQGILVNQGVLEIRTSRMSGNQEGIQIKESKSVSIVDCSINSNRQRGISSNGSGLELKNSRILGNRLSGVRIKGAAKVSLLGNRISSNQKHGISLEEAFPLIRNNVVSYNREDGITGKRSQPDIQENRIEGNVLRGIDFLDNSSVGFHNNTVSNSLTGIYFSTGRLSAHGNLITGNQMGARLVKLKSVFLKNNRIVNNRESGAYLKEIMSGLIRQNQFSGNSFHGLVSQYSDLSIVENRIEENGESGISDEGSLLLINRNRISGNKTFGIYLQETETAVIASNTINSNQEFGVSFVEVENGSLTENLIQGNYQGILVKETPLFFSGNRILNSSGYALKLMGPDDLEASNNWWGTENEEDLLRMIYDFEDDVNSGEVFLDPLAPTPEGK